MHIALLHNRDAGDSDHSPDALQALIRNAGHTCSYHDGSDDRWQEALSAPADVLAIAGGDGTIAETLRLLASHSAPVRRVAILPLGSANNIARSFGIADVSTEALIAGWSPTATRRLRLGRLGDAQGDHAYAETAGVGLFAELLATTDEEPAAPDDKIRLGLETLARLVDELQPQRIELDLDGEAFVGEYLAVEAARTSFTGPGFQLADALDPGGRFVTIILIEPRDREQVAGYVEELRRGIRASPPNLVRRTCSRARMLCQSGTAVRLDDRSCRLGHGPSFEFAVVDAGLELLVPSGSSEGVSLP